MKVLHIIDSGGVYGAEIMLLNLVNEQMKLGIKSVICSIGEPGIREKPFEAEALGRGLELKKVRMRPGLNIRGALKMLKSAQKDGFDLLHSHGYKGNILMGLVLKGLRKIPMVSTLHGWTSNGSLTKMKFYEWADSISLNHIDAVVVVSRKMLERLGPRENAFVIENGIPELEYNISRKAPVFDDALARFCEGGFAVGAIGRLSPEKGFKYLIDALYMASRKIKEIRLVIIGEGPERPSIERMAVELGLREKILFLGYKPDAYKYLPLFDLFVLPSLTEGMPISILEAMQGSIPILATNVGGVPELLGGGELGCLVEPGSAMALEEGFLFAYNNRNICSQRAAKAREKVFNTYSSRKMAEKYLELYTSLCPA